MATMLNLMYTNVHLDGLGGFAGGPVASDAAGLVARKPPVPRAPLTARGLGWKIGCHAAQRGLVDRGTKSHHHPS